MNKTCTKCGEEKPLEDFHKDASHIDGVKSSCRVCDNLSRKSRYHQDGRGREYRQRNVERIRAADRSCYRRNRKQKIAAVKAYRDSGGGDSAKRKAYKARYRAARLQRTPSWADLEAIKQIYQTCPEGYEVDHVLPLQGELVSGLHVAANLQHLPVSENRAKGNRL